MKKLLFAGSFIFGSIFLSLASAHGIGSGMMHGYGIMGHPMNNYDYMNGDAYCPAMSNMGSTASLLLSSKDQLDLSKTQIAKLEKIQNDYQKSAVALRADLDLAMLELHDLLNEDELNIAKIKAAGANLEKIENQLRTRNIDTYIATKLILTREQLEKVNDTGLFDIYHMHGLQRRLHYR
jgi:Spy/CpxP family protein refolding chaperone